VLFAECYTRHTFCRVFFGFAECLRHTANNLNPVVSYGRERLETSNQRAWTVISFCLVPFMCLPVSRLFWVSSLAHPNLLGTKYYVIVVVVCYVVIDLSFSLLFFFFICC
jgi:hypothetical protein